MSSWIVGLSPHSGHSGSRGILTSRNSMLKLSNSSRRFTSGSPRSSRSLTVSTAWMVPMQVAQIDEVVVHDAHRADACCRKVQRGWRAEAAGADQQHLGGQQLALANRADLGQDDVAGIPPRLVQRQGCALGGAIYGRH